SGGQAAKPYLSLPKLLWPWPRGTGARGRVGRCHATNAAAQDLTRNDARSQPNTFRPRIKKSQGHTRLNCSPVVRLQSRLSLSSRTVLSLNPSQLSLSSRTVLSFNPSRLSLSSRTALSFTP